MGGGRVLLSSFFHLQRHRLPSSSQTQRLLTPSGPAAKPPLNGLRPSADAGPPPQLIEYSGPVASSCQRIYPTPTGAGTGKHLGFFKGHLPVYTADVSLQRRRFSPLQLLKLTSSELGRKTKLSKHMVFVGTLQVNTLELKTSISSSLHKSLYVFLFPSIGGRLSPFLHDPVSQAASHQQMLPAPAPCAPCAPRAALIQQKG